MQKIKGSLKKNSVDFYPTTKQYYALEKMYDNETEILLFGGGAGGAKSVLGCFWVISSALKYPGTRWVIGRAVLKNLMATTGKTFFRLLGSAPQIQKRDLPLEVRFNLRWGIDFTYNSMKSELIFKNGSEIVFKDLELTPRDPEFDSLGSAEYTGAFVDEVSQVSWKAIDVLATRLRHRTEEYGIKGKILCCTNPSKNWAYSMFYKPSQNNTIKPHYHFIQALVTDNPYIDPEYVEALKRREKATRERLLFGNWEYDDDPSKLFEFDKLQDMFTNRHARDPDHKYITSDPARFGEDKAVIYVWYGLYIEKIFFWEKSSMALLREEILRLADEEGIPRSNIMVDDDGIGGAGIVDHIPGVKGFVNNSSPIEDNFDRDLDGNKIKPNYYNLKSQCYFKLSEYINQGKIGINCDDQGIREWIIEELEQIKRKNADKDGKMQVIDKKEIKDKLGRSPDFADCIMMRMRWEVGVREDFYFGSPLNTAF